MFCMLVDVESTDGVRNERKRLLREVDRPGTPGVSIQSSHVRTDDTGDGVSRPEYPLTKKERLRESPRRWSEARVERIFRAPEPARGGRRVRIMSQPRRPMFPNMLADAGISSSRVSVANEANDCVLGSVSVRGASGGCGSPCSSVELIPAAGSTSDCPCGDDDKGVCE